MAAPGPVNENQIAEVAEVKTTLGDRCRVIKDIGEFAHIVNVKMEELDCLLKFQLTAEYPMVPPMIVVKSENLADEHKEALATVLTSIASKRRNLPVILFLMNEARRWLDDADLIAILVPSAASPRSHQTPAKHKHNKKKKTLKSETETWKCEKLSPMKTSMDVISRILWDDLLSRNDFTIGYMDRHIGLVEQNFSVFSWEDIASVDYDTLAIPKHRIEYFKYKAIKVWEKKTRLDNVFGSTGSATTIVEVIGKYEEFANKETDESEETNNAPSHLDDSEDIEIDFGEQDRAEPSNSGLSRREQYWGKKRKPTHFLCLRISNPDIVSKITLAHPDIVQLNADYACCLVSPRSLHVTLACLGLDTEEDVQKAVTALENMKEDLETFNPTAIKVRLDGVGEFFRKVVFAKVATNAAFMEFVSYLRSGIQEAGIELRDVYDFNPHMTIMKMKKKHEHVMRTRCLDITRISKLFEDPDFGEQSVDGIHLCNMSEGKREDGFYITPGHIQFSFKLEDYTFQ